MGSRLFLGELMKREFKASVSREGDWFVAQCLEVDVASQGRTEEQALANLEEARSRYTSSRRGRVCKFKHTSAKARFSWLTP